MDCFSVKQAAENWSISQRRVQKLCETGRIPGVAKFGNAWTIPMTAEKPVDGRSLRYQNMNIIAKKDI